MNYLDLKKTKIYPLFIFALLNVLGCRKNDSSDPQVQAVSKLIKRILPNHASHFVLKFIDAHEGKDVFEIQSQQGKIVIRGSSGIALASGFNYYLKNFCNASYTWRGNNLNVPSPLPPVQTPIRKVNPHQIRYMFNYCVFSYSMAFWDWEEWERLIDWMAMNGINRPLALTGQEIVWQRVFEKFGLRKSDLNDFFVGPAYNAWGRMGNLDGWGGALPESWIQRERSLQHKILQRERNFGMKPILQAFSGHIPRALAEKNPQIKVHKLQWCDFPHTYLLDWQEPMFNEIAKTYIQEMEREYGTDHNYAIDPFNEMTPTDTSLTYLQNMSRTIFNGLDEADPQGIWYLMTWAFKSPEIEQNFWKVRRTKAFFDGVPNDRLIALELHGESWYYTGWRKLNGYFGKPWVWSVIQNFGDKVDMHGGLTQIVENYHKMLSAPNKGNEVGFGIAMEGLGYNPVVFELLGDMMWEKNIELDSWKKKYLLRRYGQVSPSTQQAWKIIYDYFYTRPERFLGTVLTSNPTLNVSNYVPDPQIVQACELFMENIDQLKEVDAFQYDLLNLFRQFFGLYASNRLFLVKQAFDEQDLKTYDQTTKNFITYLKEVDELLSTRSDFLFGEWIGKARKAGKTEEEKRLYEWNAKSLISLWGPQGHPGCGGLYGYAMKEWGGFYTDYSLPSWEKYFTLRRKELVTGEKSNFQTFYQEIANWQTTWLSRKSNVPLSPSGNTLKIAKTLWDKYSKKMKTGSYVPKSPAGLAVGKPVTATHTDGQMLPKYAVDGKVDIRKAWWAKSYPASLTVDLEKEEQIFGFQVYPYWDGNRYYQYTIEVSLDRKKWSQVIDMSNNKKATTPAGILHSFKIKHPEGVKGRYVRITISKNSANQGVHLVEFKIFSSADLENYPSS